MRKAKVGKVSSSAETTFMVAEVDLCVEGWFFRAGFHAGYFLETQGWMFMKVIAKIYVKEIMFGFFFLYICIFAGYMGMWHKRPNLTSDSRSLSKYNPRFPWKFESCSWTKVTNKLGVESSSKELARLSFLKERRSLLDLVSSKSVVRLERLSDSEWVW